MPLAVALGLGLLLRFVVPIPAGITLQGWTLLSIFVSAIVGAQPALLLPEGSMIMECAVNNRMEAQRGAADLYATSDLGRGL